MTAEILALLDSDPAAGILAAADLREQRAKAARTDLLARVPRMFRDIATNEHIAAEANPAHALAAVRTWRVIVEQHRAHQFACPEIAAIADQARAYLGAPLESEKDPA